MAAAGAVIPEPVPTGPAPADRELVITRVFDAPRELVFRAWTDPDHLRLWWGPHGFTVTFLEVDVRPGGLWRKCMRSPDGRDYWRSGAYREVAPPERLSFTYYSDDPNSLPGHETLVTLEFADRGSKTLMTFRQALFESNAARDAHQGGWTESLERLYGYLGRVT